MMPDWPFDEQETEVNSVIELPEEDDESSDMNEGDDEE